MQLAIIVKDTLELMDLKVEDNILLYICLLELLEHTPEAESNRNLGECYCIRS